MPTVRDITVCLRAISIKYNELSFMELLLLSRNANSEMAKRKKKGERGVGGAAKPGKLEEEGVEKREQRGRVGKRDMAREGKGAAEPEGDGNG